MKFITISNDYYKLCGGDPELLQKENSRPHVLVLSLKYKGRNRRFAIPLRSNIPSTAPSDQYYGLPPRPSTRKGNRHGLHYIKMFPITKQFQQKYWVGKNKSYLLFQQIIDKNQAQIVKECQDYLIRYEAGDHPDYSVDIDRILNILDNLPQPQQNTTTSPKAKQE